MKPRERKDFLVEPLVERLGEIEAVVEERLAILRLPLDDPKVSYKDRKYLIVAPDTGFDLHRNSIARKFRTKVPPKAQAALMVSNLLLRPTDRMRLKTLLDIRRSIPSLDKCTINVLTRAEASRFKFPRGDPSIGIMYAGHPFDTIYFPIASYHRDIFEHKFVEAQRFLVGLGATEINVRYISGWSSVSHREVGLSVPGTGGVTGNLRTARSDSQSLNYRASYHRSDKPRVVDGLLWYYHEPLWKEIANQRLHGRLSKFSMEVSSVDDFGVTRAVSSAVVAANVDIGGSFHAHVNTQWILEGTFG